MVARESPLLQVVGLLRKIFDDLPSVENILEFFVHILVPCDFALQNFDPVSYKVVSVRSPELIS